MRSHRLLSTAMAATLLMGGAAFAQSPYSSSPSSPSSTQSPSSSMSSPASSGSFNQDSVRSNLQKAGFSNIQFVQRAYLVQATSPSGDNVVMALNAISPGTSGSSASTSSPATTSSGASGAVSGSSQAAGKDGQTSLDSNLRQKLEQSGFQNIKLIPEGYVVQANSPDGQKVAITVSPLNSSTP